MPKLQRTQGSSFDQELWEEVEAAVNGPQVSYKDSGIPENFDDVLLNQDAKNEEEANYQRGQEVANTISTLGWKYIVKSFEDIVEKYKKLKDESNTDSEIIEYHRQWKVANQIVDEILRNIVSAIEVPHPDDLPE